MFFIGEGGVDVLTPDSKHVKIKLSKLDYIGEQALLNKVTRNASCIANTFCLTYVLKKADFDELMEHN